MIGIDEVGRGAWAGPLVVVAVHLNEDIDGLRDSKQLSQKQRSILEQTIKQQAQAVSICWVAASQVDNLGLTEAMKHAVAQVISPFSKLSDDIVVDGKIDYADTDTSRAEVRAEDTYSAVAAASIIAKQARDRYMEAMASRYPKYSFERHVGYGTKLHQTALVAHGISPLHRLRFKPVYDIHQRHNQSGKTS